MGLLERYETYNAAIARYAEKRSFRLVPPVGLEPTCLAATDFEPAILSYARLRRL